MAKPFRVLLMTSTACGGFNYAPSIGLHRIKYQLEAVGLECDILDSDLDSEDSYLEAVSSGTYTVIGMSVSHINMKQDLDMLCRFHSAADRSGSSCVFAAGGQEAALNHTQWLSSGLLDVIFLGFAEKRFASFCLKVSKAPQISEEVLLSLFKHQEGVVFRDGKGHPVYRPCPKLTAEEFKELSYENALKIQMPFETYWQKITTERVADMGATEFIRETVRLYTSSHCPRRCGFCSSQSFLAECQEAPSKIFMLSAEELFRLVTHYVDTVGAKGFLMSDDDFLAGNTEGITRMFGFCDRVIAAKREGRVPQAIRFFCQGRIADFLDEENKVRTDLMDRMKEAGFDNIGLGVETFSESLLHEPSINKVGIHVTDIRRVLDALLSKKIVPIIFIILGIPESSIADMAETMKEAVDYIRRGTDISVTARLRSNPGSPLSRLKPYPRSCTEWRHPKTGVTIAIEDYFIPKDPVIARLAAELPEAVDKKIAALKKAGRWEGRLYPKILIGMVSFIEAARLIGRPDLEAEFTAAMESMCGVSA